MADDLEPLPLADVLAIVENRRLRRQRIMLRSALGAGAVVTIVAGVRVSSADDDAQTTTTAPAAGDPSTSTTTTPAAADPDWHVAAVERFYDLGFTYADAERLAALWDTDVYVPKIAAGLAPGTEILHGDDDDAVVAWFTSLLDAYWTSGGTLDDAEQLAEAWGYEVVDAKAIAGARHLAGG